MAKKQSFFNEQWLHVQLNPDFSSWIARVPGDNSSAFCRVCCKSFKLSNMGRQAITSHARGPHHVKNLLAKQMQPAITCFAASTSRKDPAGSDVEKSSSCVQEDPKDAVSISSVVGKPDSIQKKNPSSFSHLPNADVTKAEIVWSMEVVSKNISLNACKHINKTFQTMFPDSSIASKFTFGKTKAAYTINHGLAPYFKDCLLADVKKSGNFVICFDESLNKVVQRGQMDQVIRFWDVNQQRVCTRYLNSVFLGRARADDLLQKFIECLCLPLDNLLQVSMDGPNVNLSFIQKLKTKMCSENPDGKALIETGVCGLHVLNGAVKSGLKASQWHLDQTLRDMYYLFKDSPARRAEYTAVTGSTDFPKKFCCVRWLENSECLERAIQIYDSVKKFTTESTLKSCPRQASLREQMQDPLLKCKLAAYKTIVSECEAFLRRFQSPKPLLPFLHTNLVGLIQSLLSRFVKPKKISGADTATKLLSLLFTEDTFLPFSRVDVGFGANKILQETKCSDKSKAEFKLQFQKFLVCLVKKLQERSPLKYKFVRGVTCFAPDLILNQANVAKIRADVVLHVLHSTNRISDDIAERVKKQYGLMCIEAQASFKSNFTAFISNHDDSVGLDEFYYNLLGNDGRFSDLFEVIKICLVLSHGNASVESGFSINKSILVENLLEQSVVSQRIVYDAINSVGGVSNVLISRRLLLSVRSSRKRYQDYLERRKLLESEEDKKLKDKRKIASELKALKEKKKKMRTEMNVQELALQEQIAELQHRHSNL